MRRFRTLKFRLDDIILLTIMDESVILSVRRGPEDITDELDRLPEPPHDEVTRKCTHLKLLDASDYDDESMGG